MFRCDGQVKVVAIGLIRLLRVESQISTPEYGAWRSSCKHGGIGSVVHSTPNGARSISVKVFPGRFDGIVYRRW